MLDCWYKENDDADEDKVGVSDGYGEASAGTLVLLR